MKGAENMKKKNKPQTSPSKPDSPGKPNNHRGGRKKMKALGTCAVCNWPVKDGVGRAVNGKRKYYHRSCLKRAEAQLAKQTTKRVREE
jgi:hypothetical protein